MFRSLLVCIIAAGCGACATNASAPESQPTAKAALPPNCIRDTASRIAPPPGQCQNAPGRTFSETDIDRTGQVDTGSALQMLDPSVTVHH